MGGVDLTCRHAGVDLTKDLRQSSPSPAKMDSSPSLDSSTISLIKGIERIKQTV